MRNALASWTRPALLVGLLLSASAVGLSRLVPATPPSRVARPETHVLISPYGVDPGAPGTLWLDTDNAQTAIVPPVPGRTVQYASLSPWLDESGRAQYVGRFAARPGGSSGDGVGLVRASFPEGQVLDLIPTEVVPNSRPCWYPGLGAKILFAGSDGLLYRYDFDDPGPGFELSDRGPRPLSWRCPTPSDVDVRLSEPCWGSASASGRILLVGLRKAHRGPGRPRYLSSHLWWVRLSDEGDAIEEVGPLFGDVRVDDPREFRSPTVGMTSDGAPVLAYFSSRNTVLWDLEIAPLTVDDAGRPSVVRGSATTLAGGCRPSFAAAFSSDGRWISAVQADERGQGSILRLDLTDRASAVPAEPAPATASTLAVTGAASVWKWSPLVTAIQALLGADAWIAARPMTESLPGF